MSDFRYIVFKAKNTPCKQESLRNVQESTRWYISVHEIRNKRKCDAAHDEQHRTSVLYFRLGSHVMLGVVPKIVRVILNYFEDTFTFLNTNEKVISTIKIVS